MRLAVVLCLAVSLPACAPAAAAPRVPRASGYEVGAWRWSYTPDEPLEGGPQRAYMLSVGRWQRLTRAVTWQTRLEYADVWSDAGGGGLGIPEYEAWSDLGRSLVVRTGLALHPPVTAGLAPYVGASLGAGLVRPGNDYEASLEYPGGWQVTTRRRQAGVGVSLGFEAGLRLFSMPGWPTVCASAGMNVLLGPGATGMTLEPLVWIGY